MWSKLRMFVATLFCNLCVLVLVFLMESQKWGQPLFGERLYASINALKIRWSMSIKIQSMGIFFQYQILPPINSFQDLQETNSGLTKFCSICQMSRSKIRWPRHNTCQSIRLIHKKMNKFLTPLNVGCLSALLWSQN